MDATFQSPSFKETTGGPARSEKDRMAGYVQKLKQQALTNTRDLRSKWPRYLDLMMGNHWDTVSITPSSGAGWRTRLVINYIYALNEGQKSVLFDQRPEIMLAPPSPDQHQYGSELNACIDSVWYNQNVSQEIEDAFFEAGTFGSSIVKVWYDPTVNNGQGEVRVTLLPIEDFFCDNAVRLRDCKWTGERKWESLSFIKENFPEKAHLVKYMGTSDNNMRDQRLKTGVQGGGFQFINTTGAGYINYNQDRTGTNAPVWTNVNQGPPRYEILEFWMVDHTEEEYEAPVTIFDPVTGEPKSEMRTFTRPMYPNGRLVTVCGDVTLQDVPAPYILPFGIGPYVMIKDSSIPNRMYGKGLPELLQSLQLELNKRRSQMVDHAMLMGNAVWIVDKDAGVKPGELTNRPGQIILKYSGKEVRREAAPQMPAFNIQLIELTIRDMREISGISAQAGGAPPKGARSGSAMEAAVGIANSRIHIKARQLETSLRDIGRLMIALIQQYYTTPRIIRVIGSNGTTTFTPFDGRNIRGDWDLRVEVSGTQPKQARDQMYIQLFQQKAIDRPALLRQLGLKDWQEICQRMDHSEFLEKQYEGWPGQPDRDRKDQSGYAFSVQHTPSMRMPPPPPPGGQPQVPMPGMPAIGGNPQGVTPQQVHTGGQG